MDAFIKDERCSDHGELFQFYCTDHREQCCTTCAASKHGKCGKLLEMSFLGDKLRREGTIDELLKVLKQNQSEQEKVIKELEVARTSLKHRQQETLAKMKAAKKQIVEQLEEMEGAFTKELDTLYSTRDKLFQTEMEMDQNIAKAIANTICVLETTLKLGSNSQLFVSVDKIRQTTVRYERLLSEKKIPDISFNFVVDERLQKISKEVSKFGILSVESSIKEKIPLIQCGVQEVTSFNSKTAFDDLRGVAILENGDIVLTDRNYKSVLLFHEDGTFVGHSNFSSRPWGVAAIGKGLVAVSLPETCEIPILQVNNKGLEPVQKLTTPRNCFGICSHDGQYLVLQHSSDPKASVTLATSHGLYDHKTLAVLKGHQENVYGITYDPLTSNI